MFGILTYLLQNPTSLLVLPVIIALKQEITRGFVGRPSLVTNTTAIFIASAVKWTLLPEIVQFYSIFGLIVGFVAFFTYIFNISVKSFYYTWAWFLYNSIFAILFPFIF